MPRRLTPAAGLACGSLLALCLPKPGLCFLAWFALAPLLHTIRGAVSIRRSALLGWFFGAGFFATALYWIYSTCRFAGVPVPAALLAWAALAAFSALQWAAATALIRWLVAGTPAPLWPWACAALWAALEFASARWTPRLPADLLAYTQWRHLAWLQGIAWAGPHALSFLIVLANAHLARWFEERRLRPLALPAALCAAWWGYGAWTLAHRAESAKGHTVVFLQPNIDQYRKWDESSIGTIRKIFDHLLTEAAKEKPALVVWPESALPGWLEEPELFAWAAAWSRRLRAHQLLGAASGTERAQYNAAVLIGPEGRTAGVYYKRQLVPFGEFVPMRAWLQPYIGILSQLGDFDAGEERQAPLSTPLGPVGVSICYEAVFPRLSRVSVELGSRILANLTNDGWYKDTWGPYQHFYTNIFRAIENRAIVLRSGNTGISAVIDPYGVIVAQKALLSAGILKATIHVADFSQGSFYSRYGDWFGWVCLMLAALQAAFKSQFRISN